MSPEQARAKDVDGRSDLFSFGAVLYEMATAHLAFSGNSSAEIFKAILDSEPAPVVRSNHSLPPEFERIVHKALEKDRNLRYQNAADLRADLARLKRDLDSGSSRHSISASATLPASSAAVPTAASGRATNKYLLAGAAVVILAIAAAAVWYFLRGKPNADQINSIAVLPFSNATADPNNEYLSDGLTDSLISSLSQLPNMKVMARSTVFRFKGNQGLPQKIGEELRVSAVLMGTVTQQDGRVRVQADLVNTADGTELWGAHYDRKMADVTEVQSDITRDIASRLRSRPSGDPQQQRMGDAGTTNSEAYRLYLEGRQLWYGRTQDGLKKSIPLFQQAIAADPNYALAYAGLADTYNVASSYGVGITSRQANVLADEASRKAVELNDSLSETHTSRAASLALNWKWSDAEREFRRAIEINPNNATAHYFYAFMYLVQEKRIDEALPELQTALSLDPLSPIINTNYAATLMMAHRYPESLAQFQKTLERDPSFPVAHLKLSYLYATTGQFANAVEEMRNYAPAASGNWSNNAKGYSESLLAAVIEDETGYADAALGLALNGDRDKAFEYLNKAYSMHDSELVLAIRFPALDSLHSDPRWADLMRRLDLPL